MNKLKIARYFVSAICIASTLGFVSCAGGGTYAETKANLPKIEKGKGRVFVYRPSSLGFGVRPKVKIDDKVVGVSQGQGFLYSDQTPGTHVVSTSTEWKRKATVNVVEGQPTFVKCSVYPGVVLAQIAPKQVERSVGEAEIQKCKLKKAN